MSARRPAAAPILRILAASLPDDLLTRCFPGHQGDEIRDALAEAADRLEGLMPKPATESPVAAEKPMRVPAVASPSDGQLVLYTDGASRGNPGLAGAGIQILDRNNNEILAASKFLGQCTNNEAEYQALIFGLQEAKRLGGVSLRIFLDSELIVRQIEGRYQVKNDRLKTLFAEVRKELGRFTGYRIGHVPRSQNQRADQMANRAIDQRPSG